MFHAYKGAVKHMYTVKINENTRFFIFSDMIGVIFFCLFYSQNHAWFKYKLCANLHDIILPSYVLPLWLYSLM